MLKSTILRQSKEQMPISLAFRKSHFERIELLHVKVKQTNKQNKQTNKQKPMELRREESWTPEYRLNLIISQNIIHQPII